MVDRRRRAAYLLMTALTLTGAIADGLFVAQFPKSSLGWVLLGPVLIGAMGLLVPLSLLVHRDDWATSRLEANVSAALTFVVPAVVVFLLWSH